MYCLSTSSLNRKSNIFLIRLLCYYSGFISSLYKQNNIHFRNTCSYLDYMFSLQFLINMLMYICVRKVLSSFVTTEDKYHII
jgi:hypothetical protein